MIVSFEHRFVFIKGKKVAGTSAEIALAQLCGPDDIITPISAPDEALRLAARNYSRRPRAEDRWLSAVGRGDLARRRPRGRFYNHMRLRDVAARFDLRDFAVLCVDRSPYAKVLSLLSWHQGMHAYRGGRIPPADRDAIRAGFDERVLEARNIDRYRWPDGRLAVQPWRFDRLETEIAALAHRLGRPAPTLPHVKRGPGSDALDPRDWFTPDQLDYIEDEFREEFDVFGYPRVAR